MPVDLIGNNSPLGNRHYFDEVLERANRFHNDFSTKNFNARLSRQVYLVSCFASLVFYYLNQQKTPKNIAWISDRDAIVDRYDGVVFDLAYFVFMAEVSASSIGGKINDSPYMIEKPNFKFVVPNSNKNTLDELIRIPDYLAGTLADFDMESGKFSKTKFYEMHKNSLAGSKNHVIIEVYGDSEDLSARRIGFS